MIIYLVMNLPNITIFQPRIPFLSPCSQDSSNILLSFYVGPVTSLPHLLHSSHAILFTVHKHPRQSPFSGRVLILPLDPQKTLPPDTCIAHYLISFKCHLTREAIPGHLSKTTPPSVSIPLFLLYFSSYRIIFYIYLCIYLWSASFH